jgi:AraC-like DNA-binding protein
MPPQMSSQNFFVQSRLFVQHFENRFFERMSIFRFALGQNRAKSHMQNLPAGILVEKHLSSLFGRERGNLWNVREFCRNMVARAVRFKTSQRIFNNFQEKISIKKIADVASISQHSFCRYFKKRTLKTYWQFLQEVRIGYACRLLIENDMSVEQVCYESGFNNLSNFNRYFKELTKKTPLQYVREYAKKH